MIENTVRAAAAITYQAGANTDPPETCGTRVKIAGANPPKIVIAVL